MYLIYALKRCIRVTTWIRYVDTKFVGMVKTSNFTFGSFKQTLIFFLFFTKKAISSNFPNFLYIHKRIFEGQYAPQLCGCIPWCWGWHLAGLGVSSQTVGSLMRTPWLAKLARKNLAQSELVKFTSVENYIPLL
jgi:hypothetical protein